MPQFIKDGGERTALQGGIYLAERLFEGAKSTYVGTSKAHMQRTDFFCKSATLPAEATTQLQIFEDGGSTITGKVRITGGATVTYYLGYPMNTDIDHTAEGGTTSAKHVKNNIVIADDISGFSKELKFTIINVTDEVIRELMLSKKSVNGIRSVSATPSASDYNRFWLVSYVAQTADGDLTLTQYRNCRIKVGFPTGGGGEEHQRVEVTVSPLRDSWATPDRNYFSDVILSEASIT